MRTKSFLVRAMAYAIMMVSALAAFPSHAQLNDLPSGIVSRLQLSPDDEATVREFVERHATVALLAHVDTEVIRQARSRLVRPLLDRDVSASFRLTYSRLLLPVLGPLISHERDVVAVNAIVIVAELGTGEAIDAVNKVARSKSAVVRYQAAYAVTRTFESIQNSAVAVVPAVAESLAEGLEKRIAEESDPSVLDGLTRAGIAACAVMKPGMELVRPKAVSSLARGLSKRSDLSGDKILPDTTQGSLLRVVADLRDHIAGARGTPIAGDARKDAAALGGDVLAHVSRVLRSNKPNMKVRDQYAGLADASELLVITAVKAADPLRTLESRSIGVLIRKDTAKDDATARDSVRQIVGTDSDLSREPFRFDGQRFRL